MPYVRTAAQAIAALNQQGFIDASSNPLGIRGAWYTYADGYSVTGERGGPCQAAGHADAECSVVTAPDRALPGFPNTGGTMCTSGTAAQVLLVNGEPDYANMWGAGMGFDLNGAVEPAAVRGVFNAALSHVVGFSFEIDRVPSGLRVEVATPADPVLVGASYWGAGEFYPPSPVQVGTNTVLFSQVQSPTAPPAPLDVAQLAAIHFFVPGSTGAPQDFSYCVRNLRLILGR